MKTDPVIKVINQMCDENSGSGTGQDIRYPVGIVHDPEHAGGRGKQISTPGKPWSIIPVFQVEHGGIHKCIGGMA